MALSFEQARRIVDGKLWAYAAMRLKYPGPQLPAPPDVPRVQHSGPRSSPQERWAVEHSQELTDSIIIERVLRRLPELERRVIEMGYFEQQKWDEIAARLNYSRRTVTNIRDRALAIFAYEFGLMDHSA